MGEWSRFCTRIFIWNWTKGIIQTLDEYANESDKTRTKVVPLKDVFAQAGINV